MSDPIRASIEALKKNLQEQENQVQKTKMAINVLHEAIGETPPFDCLEESTKPASKRIRSDQFYGKPFASAVREVLQIQNEPMRVPVIVQWLRQGGYDFGDIKDMDRAVSISLGKNTQTFVALPHSDAFGLVEWYPEANKNKKRLKPIKERVDDFLNNKDVATSESDDSSEDGLT